LWKKQSDKQFDHDESHDQRCAAQARNSPALFMVPIGGSTLRDRVPPEAQCQGDQEQTYSQAQTGCGGDGNVHWSEHWHSTIEPATQRGSVGMRQHEWHVVSMQPDPIQEICRGENPQALAG